MISPNMKYVVCHEVDFSKKPNTLMIHKGTLQKWIQSPDSTSTALGLRMIGFAGFQPFLKANVYECQSAQSLLPESSKIQIDQVFLFTFKQQVNLVMIVGNCETRNASMDFWLQRPGTAKVQQLLGKLGLKPNTEENVYSTCITMLPQQSRPSHGGSAVDGNLSLHADEKSDFVNLATYRIVCLLVSIERQLINSISRLLVTTRLSLYRIVRKRDLLVRWPSLPAIDSTAVSRNYAHLRESLNLEHRKRETIEALTLLSKRQETVLAVCGLGLAFATLCVSIWLG